MLKIDLSELLRQTGRRIVIDVDEAPASDEDVTYLSPAKGRISIMNTGELVVVRGRVQTELQLECGRCLKTFRERIDAEIEDQFTIEGGDTGLAHSAEVQIVSDEENEVPPGLMNGPVMDLNVLIRQAVILATPISPICSEECRGICPRCGKDRNDPASGCRCDELTQNRPLAALREMYNVSENPDGPADS